MSRETYVYRDGKLIPKHLAPPLIRPRGQGLQVIKDLEPYIGIGFDGKVVKSRRHHRDQLRAYGCVEVGTEAHATPPSPPPNKVDMGLVRDLKRAMGKL